MRKYRDDRTTGFAIVFERTRQEKMAKEQFRLLRVGW